MSMLRRTRSTPRGYTLPKYVCFDCGESTGNGVQVYRRADGKPIDWAKGGPDGAIVVVVHRAGTGCNKGRTSAEVRDRAVSR